MSEPSTRVLTRVRFTGKWVEYWFGDPDARYDACSKSYMLWDRVEKAELEEHVHNHGFIGLALTMDARGDPAKIALWQPSVVERLAGVADTGIARRVALHDLNDMIDRASPAQLEALTEVALKWAKEQSE